MDNVLDDMVQRLRAIELLLRTQNELLTRMLAEIENSDTAKATHNRKDQALVRKRA
jgi:hypothetical protein